jgi:hypothetical protein
MITILKTIEGNLPFSSLSRHVIGQKVNIHGNYRNIYSELYNRLFIPINYDLTGEFLDECFNEAICQSDDSNYNSDYDYESNIRYTQPKNYDKFIQFCEKEGYFEEIANMESKNEIEDYLFDIIQDNLSDFCEKVEEKPYWVEQIEREQLESFNENSDYCPLCKRSIQIREE